MAAVKYRIVVQGECETDAQADGIAAAVVKTLPTGDGAPDVTYAIKVTSFTERAVPKAAGQPAATGASHTSGAGRAEG